MSPWERRERGGLYYTRSRKEGGRVVREYIGGGVLGQFAAQMDAEDRQRREEEAAAPGGKSKSGSGGSKSP